MYVLNEMCSHVVTWLLIWIHWALRPVPREKLPALNDGLTKKSQENISVLVMILNDFNF